MHDTDILDRTHSQLESMSLSSHSGDPRDEHNESECIRDSNSDIDDTTDVNMPTEEIKEGPPPYDHSSSLDRSARGRFIKIEATENETDTTRKERLDYSQEDSDDCDDALYILCEMNRLESAFKAIANHTCRILTTRSSDKAMKSDKLHGNPAFTTKYEMTKMKTTRLIVECTNPQCVHNIIYQEMMVSNSPILKNQVLSSVLFGLTYRQSAGYPGLLGIGHYNDDTSFYKRRKAIYTRIVEEEEAIFRKYRARALSHAINNKYSDIDGKKIQKICVSKDGAWNTRGWSAKDCILFVIDYHSKIIMSSYHASTTDEGHSSQRLECDLVKKAYEDSLNFLDGKTVLFSTLVSDGDSKSHSAIEHIYCKKLGCEISEHTMLDGDIDQLENDSSDEETDDEEQEINETFCLAEQKLNLRVQKADDYRRVSYRNSFEITI